MSNILENGNYTPPPHQNVLKKKDWTKAKQE